MDKTQKAIAPTVYPDTVLLCLWFALLSVGLVMVASASVAFASATYGDSWYFLKRHLAFLVLSLLAAGVMLVVPTHYWRRFSSALLIAAMCLLALVLIPGVGKEVNGSQRWINFGIFAVQISEIAKFSVLLYFAAYFSRRYPIIVGGWREFFGLVGLLAGIMILLVLEPDFGSTVVVGVTVIAIMFVAGLRLRFLLPLAFGTLAALSAIAVFTPYRYKRLVTFMDPWADQFNHGYQLTQSLIAFGRGEWTGVGLGNSLQKLFYLPEAHTDFIFAIIAEELGLIGVMIILGLFAALIARILKIMRTCFARNELFLAYSVLGVAILFTLQVFINVGVASGLLPTKGLTLPFISYGGSSLIICCALMGFVLRADIEMRTAPESHTPVTNRSRVGGSADKFTGSQVSV